MEKMTREELELLTLAQLQEKLVEFGYEQGDADAFKTKAPIIASLLREMDRNTKLEEKPAEDTNPPTDDESAEGDLGVSEIEKSKKRDTEDDIEKVKSINERPDPKEERLINKQHFTKAKTMKHKLLGQELTSIIVPLESGEKVGVVIWVWTKTDEFIPDEEWINLTLEQKMSTHQVWVEGAYIAPQLNGYKYFIPKGRYYKVPLQVARIVTDSQQQTLDAGKHIDINRTDPRTNRPFLESF